jgi:histidinol phosphatase-like enzyme (inositol monophosphatase family)
MTIPDGDIEPETLDALIAHAHVLADRAGELLRPLFRAGLDADDKPDGSPVTRADRAVEQALRGLVEDAFPEHGIVGEELGAVGADREFVWIFDPIDGTKAFLAGKPTFTTLIALLHRGRPLVGVIDQAFTRERWVGAGGRPTEMNGEVARTRSCASLSAARFSTTGPQYFNPEERGPLEGVIAEASLVSWGGDGYQYGLVALGCLDVVVEAGLALHDWAALEPIITGAGGVITDWGGQPVGSVPGGRVVACGDARCHAQVIERLRGA